MKMLRSLWQQNYMDKETQGLKSIEPDITNTTTTTTITVIIIIIIIKIEMPLKGLML